MEHVSFVLRIDPANEAEYRRRHERVDPELEEQFAAARIHSYRIFYHEGTLFAYMAVDDFAKAMAHLAAHPANAKWQAFMSDLLLAWETGDTVKTIPEVYAFGE
ncbi:L-rhamnose mutarotase [Paenibacillus cymbidii]|uniref:L-rhamnose mutarotase n=1 Tax=Paenibacillus cymbidii TaxID=1639034 RepID=UPI0010807C5E|nr:L-rhamnose mutarotase [Paenibacillus cymbidii]